MSTASGFTARQAKALERAASDQYEALKGAARYRNVDFALYLMLVVVLAFGLRTFIMEPIRVKGDSMAPTLLHGEHMFVEKVGYWFEAPARGDVIICFYPGYTESCVKRVIALPGETVEVIGGTVYIDDEMLLEAAYYDGWIEGDFGPLTIEEDHVFVMGDNRNASKDSRASSVGAIPYTKVVGRVRAVIWPVSKWQGFPDVDYA